MNLHAAHLLLSTLAVSIAIAVVSSCTGRGANAGRGGANQQAALGLGGQGSSVPAEAGPGSSILDAARVCVIPDAAMYASVPRIDQLVYYAELAEKRADIASEVDAPTGSPCYEAMMIKRRYRADLLDGDASPKAFEAALYTPDAQQADKVWIASQQGAEVSFCEVHPGGGCHSICPPVDAGACPACPDAELGDAEAGLSSFYVSGYDLCGFVGYKEGPDVTIYDDAGLVWLVFFEFADVESDLTPGLLQVFASKLADAGFQGDIKTLTDPRLPQQAHFQYNDVIVHGHSLCDGELAEAVGLLLFGPLLSSTGRGLDVQGGGEWAAYLCTHDGGVSALPPGAVKYTEYE